MIGVGVGLRPWFGASAAPPPVSPAPAALPVAPAARWHPGFSGTVTSGGRVVSAIDRAGSAGVAEGASGRGPLAMTDALGRAFWRFEGAEFLNVPAGFVANTRDVTVFFVGRIHRTVAAATIFSLGNRAAGTNTPTNNGTLDTATASQGAPSIRCASGAGTDAGANAAWMLPGSQMQLLGAASRPAGGGGRRLWVNTRAANLSQTSIAVAPADAEIGRNAQNGQSYGLMDLYEIVAYDRGLADAEGAAVAAALTAHWGIAPVTDQIVLEGDSITQGTGTVSSGVSSGMILSDPGTGPAPAGWRVINMGTSGATRGTQQDRLSLPLGARPAPA